MTTEGAMPGTVRTTLTCVLTLLPLSSLHAETPDEVVRRLGHEDYLVRERAVRELVRMGPKAVPACLEAMRHADPEIAQRARRVQRQLENTLEPTDAAFASLASLVDSDRPEVRTVATRMLAILRERVVQRAADRRIAAIVATIEKSPPTRDECTQHSQSNVSAGRYETAIAYVRVAIRQNEREDLDASGLRTHERALLADFRQVKYRPDEVDRWRHVQAQLAACTELLDADVPDEAVRLMRTVGRETKARFHWDHDANDVRMAILLHRTPTSNDRSRVREILTSDDKTVATQLLGHARKLANAGRYREAREIAEAVQDCDIVFGLFDDRPDLVLADITRRKTEARAELTIEELEARARQPGAPPDPNYVKATEMLKDARSKIEDGRFGEARRIAKRVDAMNVEFGLFDDSPRILLADLERQVAAARNR